MSVFNSLPKTVPKRIPAGWVRLKPGASIKTGDKFYSDAGNWLITGNEGCQVQDYRSPFVYIRRVPDWYKKKAKKK